jgi:hypothetical protein
LLGYSKARLIRFEVAMRGNSIERRVAAWVLTLPGPFAARTDEDARREAHRLFDPVAPRDAFEAALRHWGYEIRRENAAHFAIAPASEASRRKAA